MRLRTAQDRLKVEHSIIDGVREMLEELLRANPQIRSVIPGVIRPVRDARGYALLDPTAELKKLEAAGNNAGRLALMDEMKTAPFGAVWDEYCRRQDVPVGAAWLAEVKAYENGVLSKRV